MRGTMITMHVDGAAEFMPLDRAPTLDEIKTALNGGWLEAVPFWDQFPFDNGTPLQPCVAYCDEEGKLKGLPVNEQATRMWHGILDLMRGKVSDDFFIHALKRDVLCGPIVILTGDDAFMRSMYDYDDEEEEE